MFGPLEFRPLYQERVWGGRFFEQALGRDLPEGKTIGESWEIVDRPEAQSVVARGPLEGKSLRELVQAHPEAMVGAGWPAERPFPILVKWLDCQDRLSLQVHPPASVADELGGEPKTENWYVAGTNGDSALIVGLREGVTREQFQQGIADATLESLVHRFPVQAGDSILVESGRLHAIDAGNLILEIQQNSDTTYRVYDWGRVGLDGKPRQLHVEQSMRCIDFADFEPEPLRASAVAGESVLADCREFRIRRIAREADAPLVLGDPEAEAPAASLLHVVKGAVEVTWEGGRTTVLAGSNVLVAADGTYSGRAVSETVVLVTDRFSQP
ncbi:class I mannose-6-phosphate isomerase [Opitutales bacterium ASA1]|uniref:type I phosphomannose isomerase catalytic subunit n=1 Tax=Congregicoccus parvus TaxID=3081749 RepID=UPI002B2FE398|nr:class I mannose-6-phosphate isomerase [Opitutales bacterium ASA1]